MQAPKVLHVIDVEKQNYYLSNLVEFTNPSDIEFSFATFAPGDSDFVNDFVSRDWNVFALGSAPRKLFPIAFRRLWKLMSRLNPDIVHTHLFNPSLIGLTAAKRQGRRTVLTRHHSDAIHEITSTVKRKFYLKLENYICRNADHIIAPSNKVRECLVEREGVENEKVSVIPYGQSTARFNEITQDEINEVKTDLGMSGSISLVNVSRLYHRKGHRYLFEAFAALATSGLNATLYLVGEGEYRRELERMVKTSGIRDRVRFLGWRDDTLSIMAAADIIVHPSLEDALSSAVIESLMLGKPIVAADISGVRDSLGNGKYGEIAKPADSRSFKEALQRTIRNLPKAQKRAMAGRQHILNYMGARRVADEYKRVYASVLS